MLDYTQGRKKQANHDPQLELWGVQNRREAFRKVFKRKLMIDAAVDNKDA